MTGRRGFGLRETLGDGFFVEGELPTTLEARYVNHNYLQ